MFKLILYFFGCKDKVASNISQPPFIGIFQKPIPINGDNHLEKHIAQPIMQFFITMNKTHSLFVYILNCLTKFLYYGNNGKK